MDNTKMTRTQATEYRRMFEIISAFDLRETQQAPPMQKLIQHVALMGAIPLLPKTRKMRRETLPVIRRWLKIEERIFG